MTDGTEHTYAARTVLWTAGVEAVPFVRDLATVVGAQTDHAGRITVNPDLTIGLAGLRPDPPDLPGRLPEPHPNPPRGSSHEVLSVHQVR